MNEAEYLMNNYGDRGGCYTASTDNTLRDLHNSSYDTKAEFNNRFSFKIIPSLPPSILSSPSLVLV